MFAYNELNSFLSRTVLWFMWTIRMAPQPSSKDQIWNPYEFSLVHTGWRSIQIYSLPETNIGPRSGDCRITFPWGCHFGRCYVRHLYSFIIVQWFVCWSMFICPDHRITIQNSLGYQRDSPVAMPAHIVGSQSCVYLYETGSTYQFCTGISYDYFIFYPDNF